MADYDEQQEFEPPSGLYASTAAARERRRKQLIVGLTGAAVVLAGAGFLVTQLLLTGGEQPSLPEPAALAPMTTGTSSTTPGKDTTPGKNTTPEAANASHSVARTPEGFKPAKPVQQSPAPTATRSDEPGPRVSVSPAAGGDVAEQVSVAERTEVLENGTIRILSAQRDLTGHRELLLAGDEGQAVGNGIRCTSDVRMETEVPASRRPGLLLCWRTSQARSVITMAVVPRGELPTASSIAVIGREWAKLG
ncbi:hypothetical protein [Actinoplanes sp. GCM10030250]|uniref:hypothetical protein n=1 Tax=Actinoplanes sp. GCM10030250 TaxID=3273376 RepID=UPI00361A7C80